MVHLLRERVRAAEEHARAGGHEGAPGARVALAPQRAGAARDVQLLGGREQHVHVAVGHADHEHEHARHADAAQRGEQARARASSA